MRRIFTLVSMLLVVPFGSGVANASSILLNGNLDITDPVEIVAGFFLPKPVDWINEGVRSVSGPYEDEMSAEPWAGPAPTPVTTDGNANPPHPDGCGGPDCAVFFKPFSGNAADLATGHLYQDNPASAGLIYTLTGWAGAEANALAQKWEFALEFLDAGNSILGGTLLDLGAAGLFVPNGMPFNYKQYTLIGVAPAGTASVRARASMIGAMANPQGGGQAFVVDDFELTSSENAVPEPATAALTLLGLIGVVRQRRRARQIQQRRLTTAATPTPTTR